MSNITDAYGLAFDDFYFTPISLERIDITNPRISGSINDTTQNALPGADITLQANTTPSNLTGGTYSWTFTGNYSVSGGSTGSSMVKIRANDVSTIIAKVTYTHNGVTKSAQVAINSVMPKLTSFTASQEPEFWKKSPCSPYGPDVTSYYLGCFGGGIPGIRWTASVEAIPGAVPPSPGAATYISDPAQSGVKLVQIVSPFRRLLDDGRNLVLSARNPLNDVETGWQLDGDDPYGRTVASAHKYFSDSVDPRAVSVMSEDSPGTALIGMTNNGRPFTMDAVYVDDRFEVYAYYFAGGGNPSAPGFQRPLGIIGSPLDRPVARLSWNWGGQVVFDWTQQYKYNRQYTLGPPATTDSPYPRTAESVAFVRQYQGNVNNEGYRVYPGTPATINQIDAARYFVRQQYLDFLLRAPGTGPDNGSLDGLDFWTSQITPCAFDLDCIDRKRIDVSRAFWFTGEFWNRPDVVGAGLVVAPGANHPFDNGQFVRWCYLNYLRREPGAGADNGSLAGYYFWLGELERDLASDSGQGAYNHLIRAFLVSGEYRGRFSTYNALD